MTAPTLTLAEFLLARIAEDEAVARSCAGPAWQNGLPATIHPDPTTYRTVVRHMGHVCGSIIADDAVHIARWDPARVLAECEAKRRIVELHRAYSEDIKLCTGCTGSFAVCECPTLGLLTLPYAEHPDYREDWRP